MTPVAFQLKEEFFIESLIPYCVEGNIVDVFNRKIFKGRVHVNVFGQIERIEHTNVASENYILPGFVDSHVHIESSMLMPSEFAQAVVPHGVVATVSDPHEIANVLGVEGLEYFIENGKQSGFKFFFGAPSCVPATVFETSGAKLGVKEIEYLMSKKDIWFLAEVMNFPAVVAGDAEILSKIEIAKRFGKPVDGHSPSLSGENLRKYIDAGISTDHECMDICEAEEKIALGMKILIREGSAAKNFNALYPLINRYPNKVMLCTDDAHPNDLRDAYIDSLVRRALRNGMDFFNVMQAASLNPVLHYNLPVGLLREGDAADFIVVDSIDADFNVLQTTVSGKNVYDRVGESINLRTPKIEIKNKFKASKINTQSIQINTESETEKIHVIKVFDKELFTENIIEDATICDNQLVSSVEKDVLKIVVLNRYKAKAKPVVGFVKGFGLQYGALCSTVAHDTHNIIAVGVRDEAIVEAINTVIESSGGIAVCFGTQVDLMPLPVAGIMSDKSSEEVAYIYNRMSNFSKQLGTTLTSPFMTLAFMALIVIPDLKICDKGLFDVKKFKYTGLISK
jgi:adenine deaminase